MISIELDGSPYEWVGRPLWGKAPYPAVAELKILSKGNILHFCLSGETVLDVLSAGAVEIAFPIHKSGIGYYIMRGLATGWQLLTERDHTKERKYVADILSAQDEVVEIALPLSYGFLSGVVRVLIKCFLEDNTELLLWYIPALNFNECRPCKQAVNVVNRA